MARGWESKSVEAQIEESTAAKPFGQASPAPEEVEHRRKLAELKLSRARVVQSLEAGSNENYLAMLRRALAELDAQIAALTI